MKISLKLFKKKVGQETKTSIPVALDRKLLTNQQQTRRNKSDGCHTDY